MLIFVRCGDQVFASKYFEFIYNLWLIPAYFLLFQLKDLHSLPFAGIFAHLIIALILFAPVIFLIHQGFRKVTAAKKNRDQ